MAVHAWVEVEVAPGQGRRVLEVGARLARRLAGSAGFRGMRVYRSESAPAALLVLTEWTEWEAARAAEAEAPVARLLAQARRACIRWDSRCLQPLFHLEFPHRTLSAGTVHTLRVDAASGSDWPLHQKEFGLRAMSLPGTIGVLGGRCEQEPELLLCALEFETDAAAEEFAGSPTWHQWFRRGAVTVWRKEPRLDLRPDAPLAARAARECRAEQWGSLSVHIESSPDGAAVVLRLHGRLDEAAAARFIRVRDAVMACGCRELTLDVSQLTAATSEGLKTLVETARQIKAAGGRFMLRDHHGRYGQILRAWHLNRAVDLTDAPAPRRRAAPTRLRSSGRA